MEATPRWSSSFPAALIAAALFAVGLLIIYAGIRDERKRGTKEIDLPGAGWIRIVQGLCLPFRGFSRSGATISTGLLLGIENGELEEFISFALAVVLTPIIIAKELMRLLKAQPEITSPHISQSSCSGLMGMVFSFVSGLFALWLLSRWLEEGRWKFFGFYCLAAAIVVFALAAFGY